MKNTLLIGLGRFGRHLAMELNRLGHQIMAVDRDEERVNECMPVCDQRADRRQHTIGISALARHWEL